MGLLKKITRPISRVLDKIVPNEIKPALPFLAAAAPFMAPGIMGIGGNTMLSRALISGGLNLGSQLAQEGSEGEFSPLSVALASGIGALTAPGSPGKAIGPAGKFGTTQGTPSAAQFLETKAAGMEPGLIKSGLEGLATGSEKLIGLSEGLATDGILSKAGAKALSIPLTQGTTDLAVAEGRRLEKQQAIDDALAAAEGLADDADRALAIRQFMEAAGYFSEDEIVDTITAAGYKAGGRVGFQGGGMDAGQMYITQPGIMGNPAVMEKIKDMREFMIANPDIEDITDYSEKYESKDPDFEGIKGALEGVNKNEKSEINEALIKFRDSLLKSKDAYGKNDGIMQISEKETDYSKFDDPDYYKNEIVSTLKTYESPSMSKRMNPFIMGYVMDNLSEYLEKGGDPSVAADLQIKIQEFINKQAKDFQKLSDEEKEIFLKENRDYFEKNKNIIPGMPFEYEPEPEIKEAKDGGLMNLGGKEMDLRKGGFVPIGKKERADDVPARLSKNEFVMTADAVRGAGGGDINKGAKRMYETMNRLEARA